VIVGIVAEKWPYPEGRPSAFFKMKNPFEAVIYDFHVIVSMNEARDKAQKGASTAGDKYNEAVRRTSPSVNENIQRHLNKQRAKRLKQQDDISKDEE